MPRVTDTAKKVRVIMIFICSEVVKTLSDFVRFQHDDKQGSPR